MHKCILIAYVIFCITSLNRCAGDSHTYTNVLSSDDDNKFFERTLFTRNTTVPKSYVVTFKYITSTFDGFINQAVIHSNAQNTTGHLDLTHVDNRGAYDINIPDQHINAEINIPNATNFNVGVELSRSSLFEASNFGHFALLRITRPKSYALICSTPEKKNTKYREWMFGERKDGDTILYARKKSGKFLGKFQYIEYEDSNVIFTAAVIKLNSKNAAVFPQKVRLTKHRFYATIYDLNRGNIAHIALIYGYRT
ncbi:uncharacterized protein LOC116350648 [Contarinia nasturtii]|uniref:uncharacterized protein LOC116350648 n=1 Tax=Contarinia nasturtii TaxID=265458 RepID=UPI0012D4774A|nr:uncharacterized protein LOC116350648 [Contarinia nasturtii]